MKSLRLSLGRKSKMIFTQRCFERAACGVPDETVSFGKRVVSVEELENRSGVRL